MKKEKITISLPDDIRHQIERALVGYGKVKILGLGIFEVKSMKGRVGYNPATKAPMDIPAYKKLAFRVTSSLKKLL